MMIFINDSFNSKPFDRIVLPFTKFGTPRQSPMTISITKLEKKDDVIENDQ
jgi:hypothetical protein